MEKETNTSIKKQRYPIRKANRFGRGNILWTTDEVESRFVFWYLQVFFGEVIGCCFLMFFGCTSYLLLETNVVKGNLGFMILQMGFIWGAVVGSVITAIGHISRAHLNPAVTLCAFLLGHISPFTVIVYVISEILGCTLGVYLLILAMPDTVYKAYRNDSDRCGFCTTVPHKDLTPAQAILLEFMATSILIYVVCSVWDWRNERWNDSTAIKFTWLIFLLTATVGPFTGASMNPARSLGPAIVTSCWKNHWLYWAAPLLASVVTTIFYRVINGPLVDDHKDFDSNLAVERVMKNKENILVTRVSNV